MSVTVYGSSDDLIEVEGDVREEFDALDVDDGALLAFSDGTVLRVTYDGVWRISPVISVGHVSIDQAPEDDEDNYSDRAVITGPIRWVVFGSAIGKAS